MNLINKTRLCLVGLACIVTGTTRAQSNQSKEAKVLSNLLQITVDSTKGDIFTKKIDVFFTFHNNTNEPVTLGLGYLNAAKALSDNGKFYYSYSFSLDNRSETSPFYLERKIKPYGAVSTSLSFEQIPKNVHQLTSITGFQRNIRRDSIIQDGLFELKSVNINWYYNPLTKSSRTYVDFGAGFSNIYFKTGYVQSFPFSVNLRVEHKFINAISIGLLASYSQYKFDSFRNSYRVGEFTQDDKALFTGLKASYYFNKLLKLPKCADLYAGLEIGYIFINTTKSSILNSRPKSGFGFGPCAGARYFISSHFGFYAEGGYTGLSFINGGISFKL